MFRIPTAVIHGYFSSDEKSSSSGIVKIVYYSEYIKRCTNLILIIELFSVYSNCSRTGKKKYFMIPAFFLSILNVLPDQSSFFRIVREELLSRLVMRGGGTEGRRRVPNTRTIIGSCDCSSVFTLN